MLLQNFPTFREVFYLDGSSIKVVGTTISLANVFEGRWELPFQLHRHNKNKPFIRYKYMHTNITTCIFGPFCDKEGISEEVQIDPPIS